MSARDGIRCLVEVTSEDFTRLGMGEDSFAGGKEVGETSDGVEVCPGALVAREVEYLFRGHIPRRACDCAVREIFCADGFCDAEVREHDAGSLPVVHEQDVVWLDVPVNDVPSVRVRERVEEFEEEEAHLQPGQRGGGFWERAAGREFHRIILASGNDFAMRGLAELVSCDAVVEDADDGWVVQACDGADFVRERLPEVFVLGAERGKDFDRDGLAEFPMNGFPDDTHGSLSDGFDEIEWSD